MTKMYQHHLKLCADGQMLKEWTWDSGVKTVNKDLIGRGASRVLLPGVAPVLTLVYTRSKTNNGKDAPIVWKLGDSDQFSVRTDFTPFPLKRMMFTRFTSEFTHDGHGIGVVIENPLEGPEKRYLSALGFSKRKICQKCFEHAGPKSYMSVGKKNLCGSCLEDMDPEEVAAFMN